MPKASVKRLIDNRKDKLIEFVLDIENTQNLFLSVIIQKFMREVIMAIQ